MKTERYKLIENIEEIEQADKLGMDKVKAKHKTTKLLFYKRDVRRVWVDEEGDIIVLTSDDAYLIIGYEETTWKQLEKYFKDHDDDE